MDDNAKQETRVFTGKDVHFARRFNMDMTTEAMNAVLNERIRQVRKGRDGAIPYPCEDPDTNDIMRMGVLGEEFGEICTAIIERQGRTRELEEYIHVAAVAVACAEGMMKLEGYKMSSERGFDGEGPTNQAADMGEYIHPGRQMPTEDPAVQSILTHENILGEALAIYASRMGTRGELWRRMGVRGQLMNMRLCMDRLWERYWTVNSEDDIDVDDALDLLNYTTFMIRLLREGEPTVRWVYPDDPSQR